MPRTMKRHDTGDPITGTAFETDKDPASPTYNTLIRADLTPFTTLNFFMKLDGATEWVTGEAINIEKDEVTPGPTQDDGLPLNRGRWAYEQTDADVDTASASPYKVELEGVLPNGKKVHFPNKAAANEKITIEPDIDDL